MSDLAKQLDPFPNEIEELRSWPGWLARGDGTTANAHDHHIRRHGSITP